MFGLLGISFKNNKNKLTKQSNCMSIKLHYNITQIIHQISILFIYSNASESLH